MVAEERHRENIEHRDACAAGCVANLNPTCRDLSARTLNESELIAWGEGIGRTVEPPLVVALRGDLGAGKTTLARAIARGAGVRGPVPSPTYNMMFRYPAERNRTIVHLDLFRTEHPDDVWALGWRDLPSDEEIVLIEWPERAESYLPPDRWEIVLASAADPDRRVIDVVRMGSAPLLPAVGGG